MFKQYEYTYISKHKALFPTLIILLAMVIVTGYLIVEQYPHISLVDIVLVWLVPSLIIMVGLLGDRRNARILQPIRIYNEGIEASLYKNKKENKYKEKFVYHEIYVTCDSIQEVEGFRWPDPDYMIMGNNGIRIHVDDKKILIWEHIQGYSELCQIIESNTQKVL